MPNKVVQDNFKWPKHKDHLNKSYLEELAYKLWNTKGTRFVASERLLLKNNLSNISNGFLSAYLICYSLFSVYRFSGSIILDDKIIAFASTTLSILLLVFTQMESAQDYKMRALDFHKCSLEVSELHDEVRLFKTMGSHTEEEKIMFCKEINKRYQDILRAHPNHDPIDYQVFRSRHKQYYELRFLEIAKIEFSYFISTKLLYYTLIGLPIIISAVMFILKS